MVAYNNKNLDLLQQEKANTTVNGVGEQESIDKVQSMISTIFQMPLETDLDIDIAYKNMKEDLLNAVKELIEEENSKDNPSVQEEKVTEVVEIKEDQLQVIEPTLKEVVEQEIEETLVEEVIEEVEFKEEQLQMVEPTLEGKKEQEIEEAPEEEATEVVKIKEEQSQIMIPISRKDLQQSLFIHVPLSQLVIEQNQIVGIELPQSQVAITTSQPLVDTECMLSQISDKELLINEQTVEEKKIQDTSAEETVSELLVEEEQSFINLQNSLSDEKNDIKPSQRKHPSVVKGKGLMIMKNPKSSFSEAIKSIRTNLQFAAVDKEIKTILVTSPEPGDGKSSISSNLAGAYAQDNKKVLIIDCDLRKGRQAEIFGANKYMTGGYTNLILNYKEDDSFNIEDYIEKTDIENIELISNGPVPPNPIELLASEKNKELLKELENNYDIIILDCPPVLGLSDTLIMTKYSDANIVVISKGKTKVELLAEVKKHFEKANTTITGVVLNKAKQKHNSYYGYYGEV